MDLVNQALGSEGNVTVQITGGKLVVKISHNHASGSVSVLAEEDASYFFDKLAAAIPGTLDDMVLAVIKEAVKKL